MTIKIIDNFLSPEAFGLLEANIINPMFPWYLQKSTDYDGDGRFQFTYLFFDHLQWIGNKDTIAPFLDILDPIAIRRIKANLQPPTEQIVTNNLHVDIPNLKESPITTGVFYLNTNDGKTIFETGEEVSSVANRMVLFNNNLRHTGTTCTGTFPRIVINFNLILKK